MVLVDVAVKSQDNFFNELGVSVSKSKVRNSFVFVHGYNVTFTEAAMRTAQMAYDLGFDGAPVFYSWPSKGTLLGYPHDSDNVKWSEKNLLKFLEDFLEKSDSENVYLIAHSMGSRALTGALTALLKDKAHLQKKLKEVILAAPDIDADVFRRDIVPAITVNNQNVTLYASSTDRALLASKVFNGNVRAGDSQNLLIVNGIETVDATSTSTSIFDFGHSYFGQSPLMQSDLSNLIFKNLRAEQRCNLEGFDSSFGKYWALINSRSVTCFADQSGKPLRVCCPN
jgi:esterase/lipase superfamily enzyme